MKKATTKLLKPFIKSYKGEGCQFEVYSKELNAMVPCGKVLHNTGSLEFNVCTEHYDYMVALGKNPRRVKR